MENHIKEKRENLYGSNLQSIYSFLDVTKPSLICRLSSPLLVVLWISELCIRQLWIGWITFTTLSSINTFIKQSFTTEDATKSAAPAALRVKRTIHPYHFNTNQNNVILMVMTNCCTLTKGEEELLIFWLNFIAYLWMSLSPVCNPSIFLQPDYITIYGRVHW